VDVLSGGEKSRLGLVKLLLNPPNVLLLDEPTTHLDMASIDALIAALQQFEGTIIFISHDVYFIRSLATRVLHINAGKLTWYAGGYEYYLDKSGATSAREGVVAGGLPGRHTPEVPVVMPTKSGGSIFKTKEQKQAEARVRQEKATRRREAQKRVQHFEKEISRLEERQKELTAELEDPSTYETGGRAMDLNRELLGIAESMERLHTDWEQAAAELEALG
jgi:ATP-binding cassette subfamily F protein 3